MISRNTQRRKDRNMNRGVLYISYDGMLEALGQSQVLSYLKYLAKNRCIHLISFEKPADWANTTERSRITREIAAADITWHPLPYHKHPSALATAWDIACGVTIGCWLILRHQLSIVHARSYVPSVMAIILKKLTRVKYLFDMRGFWADERIDGELWSSDGVMYRVAKNLEKHFLLTADHVVCLTHAASNEIKEFEYLKGKMPDITVIPTCTDLTRFRRKPYDHIRGQFTLGYVGSAGTWYRFDAVASCFAQLLRIIPDARFLIINKGQHAYIRNELRMAGIADCAYEILATTYNEVPNQMARMDAGIFFYRPTFSRKACAPTKLGEFLGCGIPCLSNVGVGDLASFIEDERVGVALNNFDSETLTNGLEAFLKVIANPTTASRCVATAEKYFSLDRGVKEYNTIYNQIGLQFN
jgi:glycosyltransferase involved in cell wall biosynthesis